MKNKMLKLVLIILVLMICIVHAYPQAQGITLKVSDLTLDRIFEQLENISGYTFLYNDKQVEQAGKRTLHYHQVPITTIMAACLKGTGLTYEIIDRTIVIIPTPTVRDSLSVPQELPEYVTIEGYVKSKTGEVLAGVNIFVKNFPGVGIVTDRKGYFKTKARLSDILIFSHIGYKNKELFVKSYTAQGNIFLEEEHTKMDEVQVVGYGVQRKITVTGAISTMDLEGKNFPVTSFSNMLAGNVSGIIGVQRSGEPGQDVSEFWIRGISTFGANDKALILIDGVERTTFNDLIAEDIASFSVLKDASATAVYGARGANGVVLIHTKSGMPGRMKINVNARTMWSTLPRLPHYLRAYDYARLANEAKAVRGESPLYTPEVFDVIRYHLDPDLYPDVNWQKELLKKWTKGFQVNLNMSGGGDIGRYFISLNYKTNDAAYKESGLNRYHTNVLRKQYSFRTNVNLNLTPSTEVEVKLATTVVDMNRPGIGTTDSIWEAQAALTPLAVPVRYSTGHAPAYGDGTEVSPAVLLNETGFVSEFQNNMEFKLGIHQNISALLPGCSFSGMLAYDIVNVQRSRRTKMPELFRAIGRDINGKLILKSVVPERKISYESEYFSERRLYVETKVNYDRTFGEHRVGGLLLFNLSEYTPEDKTDEISSIPRRTMGMAGRMTYSFRDIYLSELNFGYNGTENFPRGKRFCFFPSVSVGLVLSGYRAIQEALPALHFLKLRYSFGIVGNDQIAGTRFPYLTYISSDVPGYQLGGQGEYFQGGIAETVLGNRNLVWEKSYKHDLGINLDIGKNIQFEADYFSTMRNHIFMQRNNIPDITGWPNMPYGNVGKMRNRGFDAALSYKGKMGAVAFELRGNVTVTRNKLLAFDESGALYDYQRRQGKSLNVTRGYLALGYFRDSTEILHSPAHPGAVRPGDLKYKDVNADGVIDEQDMVPIGNSDIPRIQYGVAVSLQWKNWEISVFGRGAGAVDFFYGGMGYFPFQNGSQGNVLTMVGEEANRWIPAWYSGNAATENPEARFPRLSYGENTNNFLPSTHWLANAAYFRLKTLEVGYTFSSSLLRRIRVKRLRLSLMGDNLHVWDKVRYWDPEQASSNGAVYPLTRSWIINLQLNF